MFVLQLRVQSVNPEMKNSLVLTVIYTIEYFRNIYEKRESLRNVIIVNHGAVSTFRAGPFIESYFSNLHCKSIVFHYDYFLCLSAL